MSPTTRRLHQQLIRLLKGGVSAWEEWLAAQPEARIPDDPSVR